MLSFHQDNPHLLFAPSDPRMTTAISLGTLGLFGAPLAAAATAAAVAGALGLGLAALALKSRRRTYHYHQTGYGGGHHGGYGGHHHGGYDSGHGHGGGGGYGHYRRSGYGRKKREVGGSNPPPTENDTEAMDDWKVAKQKEEALMQVSLG